MLKSVSIEGRRVLLLVEDHQLVDDTLLSYLNQLVTTGDVLVLFEGKELGGLPIKELYRKQLGARVLTIYLCRVWYLRRTLTLRRWCSFTLSLTNGTLRVT